MKNKAIKLLSIILVCSFIICLFEYNALSKNNYSEKMSVELRNELSKISYDTKLQVMIAGQPIKSSTNETLTNRNTLLSTINPNINENDLSINEIQNYIKQKRQQTKETYIKHNEELARELDIENNIIYIYLSFLLLYSQT